MGGSGVGGGGRGPGLKTTSLTSFLGSAFLARQMAEEAICPPSCLPGCCEEPVFIKASGVAGYGV